MTVTYEPEVLNLVPVLLSVSIVKLVLVARENGL